jgi:hypothetical protein
MLWRVTCLLAWIMVLISAFYHVEQLPPKLILFGFDITHDVALTIAHQFGWMLGGLILAGSGLLRRTYSYIGTILSSLLYFIWRYGAGTLRHGLVTDWRMKWGAASEYHYEFMFLVQDVVLPIAFVAVIVMTLSEVIRRAPANANR